MQNSTNNIYPLHKKKEKKNKCRSSAKSSKGPRCNQ